jgi:hypothetical protein
VPKRYSSVLGAKKTIFGLRYGLPDFIFLFLVELGICVQNLIFTKVVEGCQKNYFPQRGMLKFTYTVAESMPELGLKSSKPHNFSTVSPNVTYNGSLESYHPYL